MNLREIDRWIRETQEAAIEEVRAGWAYDKRRYRHGDLDAKPVRDLLESRLSKYLAEHSHTDIEGRRRPVGIDTFCSTYGLNANNFIRLRRKEWVTPLLADHICCSLGLHPVDIYGSAWTDDVRLFV